MVLEPHIALDLARFSKLQTELHHGKQQRANSAHCAGYGRRTNCGFCRAGDWTEDNASGWHKFARRVANSIVDGAALSSPTAAEETLTPEPTTTTTRTLPGAEPMAIIPAESGPPPQYDEHEKDAITTPAPAVTLPQTNEKVLPIAPQVPVSQRAIPLAQLVWPPSAVVSSEAFAAHFYRTVWKCVTIHTTSVHTVAHKSLFIHMKAQYSNSDRIYPGQSLKHQDAFNRRSQL
ncbi:hypothetical protein PENFLA_c015G02937 [Penicillium flavigenum]|uniref:Uncharacterized protein n=1 Tax=Penicillium flavigenum TaxID=254877 RepID=A0A1V6T3I6_9EURO|nr:hypothetical protein PENFLA_c015G02937 [Penicillium flavigenum]